MAESLATFLASFFVALITGLIAYTRTGRKNAVQQEYDQQAREQLLQENVQLKKEFKSLSAVVEDLRSQVIGLQHFKELYETLKEAHTRLKEDHEALRKDFQDKMDSWNSIKQDLERERGLAQSLQEEIEDLRQRLVLKDAEIGAFERALGLVGLRLTDNMPLDNSSQ